MMMMMVEMQQCSESESRIATGDLTAADAYAACCRPTLVDHAFQQLIRRATVAYLVGKLNRCGVLNEFCSCV